MSTKIDNEKKLLGPDWRLNSISNGYIHKHSKTYIKRGTKSNRGYWGVYSNYNYVSKHMTLEKAIEVANKVIKKPLPMKEFT